MEANFTTSEGLSHVFGHLSMQAEASGFWKCPFPGCTDRMPRDALPDLDVFVSLLGNFPRNSVAGKHPTSTHKKLSEMAGKLAQVSCTAHREYVEELDLSDRWDDLESVQRTINKQLQQVGQNKKSDPSGFLSPSTPVRSTSKTKSLLTETPGTYDDPGYFTRSKGKSRNGAMPPGPDDFSSPYTPGADTVFDGDSPYGEVDTPGTGYSVAAVSRTLFRKEQESLEGTPTRKNLFHPLSASRMKSNEDEDTTEAILKHDTADAPKTVDTAENEENSDNIVDFSNTACKSCRAKENDNKFKDGINKGIDASKTKLQVIEKYRPDLKVASKTEKLFRARAVLHDVLDEPYDERERSVGKIYVAIDIDDPTLKGHFKVGVVTGLNTVSRRYTASSCLRKRNLRFVAVSDNPIAGAYRVEKLVHRELHAERKCFECKHCSTKHQEWFKTDLQTVVSAVNRWTMFASLASSDEEHDVGLTRKVKDFMAKRYNYDDFIESFISEAGYTAERGDLVTFVNINDKKNYSKAAKSVSEMKVWEGASTKNPGQVSYSTFSSTTKRVAKVRVEEQHVVPKDSGLLHPQKPPVSSKAHNIIGRKAQQMKDIVKDIGRRMQKDRPQREGILAAEDEAAKGSLRRRMTS